MSDDGIRATLQEVAVSRETLGELRAEVRWLREHLDHEVQAFKATRAQDSAMIREIRDLLHGKELDDNGGLLGEVRAQRVDNAETQRMVRWVRGLCATILLAVVLAIVKQLL